jgi:hypothetical protein
MAEVKTYALNHKEVTEALINHQNIHEGFWQIHVELNPFKADEYLEWHK